MCRRFTKLRIFNTFVYKYKQNLVSKISNSDKSQTPQFRETAVSRRCYFVDTKIKFLIGRHPIFIVSVDLVNLIIAEDSILKLLASKFEYGIPSIITKSLSVRLSRAAKIVILE